jgi:hypothetical protein
VNAILLVSGVTVVASFLGDAALVPITEVGSLAAGVGWLSAAVAYIARERRPAFARVPRATARRAERSGEGCLAEAGSHLTPAKAGEPRGLAWLAAAVSLAIILMKVLPPVPGSFTGDEWAALALWSALGCGFWMARRRNR